MIINNKGVTNFSEEALLKLKEPEPVLTVDGKMAYLDDSKLLIFNKGIIKKVTIDNKILWEKDISDTKLLYFGKEAIIVTKDDNLTIYNADGKVILKKDKFLENPKVLCVKGDLIFLSGEIDKKEHITLLNKNGEIKWCRQSENTVLSGEILESGMMVLNQIDENAVTIISLISSKGTLLWKRSEPSIVLLTKFVPDGICVVTMDRAFNLNFEGEKVWENKFNEKIYKVDIGDDGSIVSAVKQSKPSSDKGVIKISFISPESKNCWHNFLNEEVLHVSVDEFIYIACKHKILILTKAGELKSSIRFKGIKDITIPSSSYIIISQGAKSSLLDVSGGG